MKSQYLFAKDFIFLVPIALIIGAGLAALQSPPFWVGWLGFSALLLLGLIGMIVLWRWAGSGKALAWMTGLALLLRLASGVAVYIALPINGHNVPDDKAGFVFTDAHRRDDQAWQLASSGQSLFAAFDKTYYTDQYGGLLALSALTYKVFSPDAHRPLLILLLAALTAALGVPFFYKATRLLWDPSPSLTVRAAVGGLCATNSGGGAMAPRDGRTGSRLALFASWLFVLYPESILTGGAQMREPFLLTFIAMALWGFAAWLKQGENQTEGSSNRSSFIWMGAALIGMLLVSPAMALALIVLFVGWLWLRGEHKRLPVSVLVGVGVAFFVGILFLSWSLARQNDFGGGSAIAAVLNWPRHSVLYVIHQLKSGSGQIQNVFSKMNPLMQFLFVVGYGITQPVLPPAFFEPTTLTWHIIAIFRSIGWYIMLPLLIYAPIAAWRSAPGRERRLWLWLTAFVWMWILIADIRAGGSQWDNPRYRLIFFGIEALVIGYAWLWWRDHRDSWLPRILALEVLCVLLYGQWYVARYVTKSLSMHLPIMVVLLISLVLAALIFAGGWAWDRWRGAKKRA